MILYTENDKKKETPPKELLKLINEVNKVDDARLICKNLLHFYTLIINYQKVKGKSLSHVQLFETPWTSFSRESPQPRD